jgi:arylsulfatase A-like enzyme
MARRLVERGVRCVQVYHTVTSKRSSCQLWDQHGGLRTELPANCAATDRPIAGLLKDLKARGLLDDTLVIWGGEFGRTPTAEGTDGREHHPFGFTMWLAGGGVRGGLTYGATDEFGWHAVENKVHVHDLHATILHLMGIDHEKLTYRYDGRDYRLTDVYGNVVKAILA